MDEIFEKLVLYYDSISSWLEKPNDFSEEEQKRFKWIFWGSIGILYIILTILFGAINFWGSLLLGAICGYILWNTKWKLWKRILASCFVYITLVSILPYNNSDSMKEAGWEYICDRLRSPSTARLVGYASPDESACVKYAKKFKIDGLSVAMYSVDAQNGFGAMIRTDYLVFFKDSKPMYCEDSDEVEKCSIVQQKQILQLNGF